MSDDKNPAKDKKVQSGIPFENENASQDPNRSPKGDDKSIPKNPHHDDYVEPYNKKKFHNDKNVKKEKKERNK